MTTTAQLIAAEASARKAADAKLQTQIDALTAQVAKLTPVPTPPAGKIWTAPSSVTTSQLEAAIRDMTLDGIILQPGTQLAKGVTGDMPSVHAGVDRSARPLTIVAPGLIGSPGIYYDGQWNWYGAKSITYDDAGSAASGYQISQAGFHGIGGTYGLTIRSALTGVTLSPTTDPWKTWLAYISGARNDNLTLDVRAIGQGNLWSGVQIDSTTVRQGGITVRITASDLALAWYEDVPTDDLDLTATLTNCRDVVLGHSTSRTGASVIFHQAQGTYRVTKDAASGPVVVNASGMVAA